MEHTQSLIDNTEQIVAGTKEEVDTIQASLVVDVCEAYGRPYQEGDRRKPSMRDVAKRFHLSPMKVKKILVTGGLFQTGQSERIQQMYASGMSMAQIAQKMNMTVANVNTYLPYKRVIYNLEIRNQEAIRSLTWRRKWADHEVGQPAIELQMLFEQSMEAFSRLYPHKLHVRLFVCNAVDGSSIFLYLLRTKGYHGNLPGNVSLDDYIQHMRSHIFMHGPQDMDGILIRDDQPHLQETILQALAQIYCRRYEIAGGSFYLDHCECTLDAMEREMMCTGYMLWSAYISERMALLVLGRNPDLGTEEAEKDQMHNLFDIHDVVHMLLHTAGQGSSLPYPNLRAMVASHGDTIEIDKDFIRRLGQVFLIEQSEMKLERLHESALASS